MPETQLTPDDRDDVREFIADLSDIHRLAEVFPGVVTPAGMARVLPEALRPELKNSLSGSIAILAQGASNALGELREGDLEPDIIPEYREQAQLTWTQSLSNYISTAVFEIEMERSDTSPLESAIADGWKDAELELAGSGPRGHGAVYVITTPRGQYVGQSTQPMPRRWRQHQRSAQAGSHLPVHTALAETLPHLFGCRFEVVEVAESNEHLDQAEQRWIDKLQPSLNSRNQTR